MKEFQAEVATTQSKMDDLETLNQAVQGALIFDNVHTSYSMEMLRANWHQMNNSINRTTNEMENQVSQS